MTALFLFTRDLRLGDHAGLAEASRWGDVVPVLVLDPTNSERIGRSKRRAGFYCDAVRSLAAALEERKTNLVVRRGQLIATVERLVRETGAETVTWSSSYDAAGVAEDRALAEALEEAGIRALAVHDMPVVAPEDTAAARSSDEGAGYRAFVPYVNAWLESLRQPFAERVRFEGTPRELEALPKLGDFGFASSAKPSHDVTDAETSEARALAKLEAYLAGPALGYLTARNVPSETTSRLSAELSFGTLAARTVVAAVNVRLADRFLLAEERLSLEAFRRGLALRDFFFQLAWFYESRPDQVLQPRMRYFPFEQSHPALEAWLEARTGFPLVDAGMRELHETGWMHPRARAVAASFLCFDLAVDWRVGRDAWERELIEDDPVLASGNWQWIAGVGADLAQFPRIYNPRRQARAFDPRGTYVRRWVPELAALPESQVLTPISERDRSQLRLPLFAGAEYPAPIVDHDGAAREFLRRYVEFVASARLS